MSVYPSNKQQLNSSLILNLNSQMYTEPKPTDHNETTLNKLMSVYECIPQQRAASKLIMYTEPKLTNLNSRMYIELHSLMYKETSLAKLNNVY